MPAAGYRFGLWLQAKGDVFHHRDCAAARRNARAVVAAFPHDAEGLFWMAVLMNFPDELALSREGTTTAVARDRDPRDYALGIAIDLAYPEGRFCAIAVPQLVQYRDGSEGPVHTASSFGFRRRANSAMWAGVISQQPPTVVAPVATQPSTMSA